MVDDEDANISKLKGHLQKTQGIEGLQRTCHSLLAVLTNMSTLPFLFLFLFTTL
jgi:hypothetical protein